MWLQRNVMRLYRFLCEHYDPGDRIYLFGFSRGAFTARVLADLVLNQVLSRHVPRCRSNRNRCTPRRRRTVRRDALAEAPQLAAWEYRAYRRKKYHSTALVRYARNVRDVVLSSSFYSPPLSLLTEATAPTTSIAVWKHPDRTKEQNWVGR